MTFIIIAYNKELNAVAVKRSDDDSAEFIVGTDMYIESADKAARRIINETLGEQVRDDKFSLIRRESTTVINGVLCEVRAIAVYLYSVENNNTDLTDTGFTWVTADRVFEILCRNARYADALYLSEAISAV